MRPETLAALLAAAALAQDPPPQPAPPAPPDPGVEAEQDAAGAFALRFAWPAEGSVAVTAAVARESGSGRFEFDLVWAPEGDRTRVRFERLRVCEINGIAPEDPGFDVARAAIGPELCAPVPFYVGTDGEFAALVEADAAAEDVRRAAQGFGEAAGEVLLAALRDPEKRAALENRVAESWAWWAAFWIDYDTAPGESAEADVSLPSGLAGRPLAARLTQRCVDAHEAGDLRAAHMRAKTVFDPEDMLAVTLATLRRTSAEKVPDDALRAVSRVDQVDGVYLQDLRPIRVRWRKEIRIDGPEQATGRVEQEVWAFDWEDVDAELPSALDHDEE